MQAKVSEIIAQAFVDLGVSVVTNVPGLGGTQVYGEYVAKTFKQHPVSFHEEVAYTISHSAAICGKRSAFLGKSQGVAKAMNSITDSLYTDMTAGFVSIIFDDKTGRSSDNILEIEPLLKGAAVPHRVASPDSIYEDVVSAFRESEKSFSPFFLILDAAQVENTFEYERRTNLEKKFTYQRDIYNHVVHPFLSDYQYKVFSAKKFDGDRSIIKKPALPNIPNDLPEKYKEAAHKYLPFFELFSKLKRDITTGDTSISSSFAFPPYNAIDIVTYIGGSIPLAIGAYIAGNKKVWALTGDFGFLCAGHLGLMEAVNRQLPIKIVIFNNKSAAATGGQKIDKKLLPRILSGFDQYVTHISSPSDLFEVEAVLKEVNNSDELKVVVVDY
ncbi:MAG: thiamine pyrophosphate-dependent enzyme [Melioribacteraceae bacterium]|nr:thiamine pyrophosphate-dependent enzyme [Melioribacteraceae bacterium]